MADKSKKTICLFNCDNTYKLDVVEAFLMEMNKKHGFNFAIGKHNFELQQLADYCKTRIPQIQMDCAIFVVQAHESRLSINEDNAGIGYAKIYRALLDATGKLREKTVSFNGHGWHRTKQQTVYRVIKC